MKKVLLLIVLIFMINFGFGQLVPNTKLENFNKIQKQIYPIIKVELSGDIDTKDVFTFDEKDEPLNERICGDLLLFFGVEKETRYELILKKDLPETIGIDSLKAIAILNLMTLIGDSIKMSNTNFGAKMITCGYNFEASLIIADSFWKMINEYLEHDFIIGIPSKDLFFIADKNDRIQIEKLKETINEIHENGEYLLSRKLYTFIDRKLVEYVE